MKTIESMESRCRDFFRLIEKHFPQLKAYGCLQGFSVKHPLGFFARLIGALEPEVVHVHGTTTGPFNNEWEEIVIDVYKEEFWEVAQQLGKEYEELSRKEATIVRKF